VLFHSHIVRLAGGKAESIWDIRRLTATGLSSPCLKAGALSPILW
jgi:hypothetical protein